MNFITFLNVLWFDRVDLALSVLDPLADDIGQSFCYIIAQLFIQGQFRFRNILFVISVLMF